MHNNPFPNIKLGLQHGSYNTPARDYRPIGDAREIETVDRNPYKYKYQGQERQYELNLNWDSFKWRNYDYAIGRFMSIDPLSEEYVYNSPYAFQENKMGLGRELEGLELAEGDNMKYNRKIEYYQSVPASNGSRNLVLTAINTEATTSSGTDEAVVSIVNERGQTKEIFTGPLAVSEYKDKLKTGDLSVYKENNSNYNINSKKFRAIKPTVHHSIAKSSIADKAMLVIGLSKFASNPKKTPINISPDLAESLISIETIRDAKYKLMTIGPGNSVNIPVYNINEETTNSNNQFNINIEFQGFDTSNNPIFKQIIEHVEDYK